jgi:hypothetical protein
VETVEVTDPHVDETDAPTCSKCSEKDSEIARLKTEVERLSNELCEARMQSKFDVHQKQRRNGEFTCMKVNNFTV